MRSIHAIICTPGIALGLLLAISPVAANTEQQIQQLLRAPSPPPGIVFEIAEGDEAALQWAIPAVRRYAQQLRARFPQLELAVVSHGTEQFALSRRQQAAQADLHQQVQSLVAEDIPVHVCGTHASWRDLTVEDFPAYVDVAPAGPLQIRDYESLGYVRVLVEAQNP